MRAERGAQGSLSCSGTAALLPLLHPLPQHPCFGLGKGQLPNSLCLSQTARTCLPAKLEVIRGCCLAHQILMFHKFKKI